MFSPELCTIKFKAMKEEIIKTAITFYAKYGIKDVTMDQIAKQLHISKKTIYQEFENKEQLVYEAIRFANNRLSHIIRGSEAHSDSPLEAILLISSNICNYLNSFCPAFYRNINRFINASRLMDKSKEHIFERFKFHFTKGVEQGIFIPENDYQVISVIFIDQLKGLLPQYQLSTIFTFLRGISTENGQQKLQEYANIHNKMNINHKNFYKNGRKSS